MLNFDALLKPINDLSPCGEDMSFSSAFDQIRTARKFDDPSLDQGDWVTELKEADWPLVVARCTELIESQSKDLRLGMWLVEALAKTQGFAAMGQGLELLAHLCDRYWEQVHPLPDADGDYEQRIGSLSWLADRSAGLFCEIPLVEREKEGYGLFAYEGAQQLAALLEKNPSTDAADVVRGRVTADMFDKARRASSAGFYAQLQPALQACRQGLDMLESVLDKRLGMNGPSFSAAKESLEKVARLAKRFAQDAGVAAPAPAAGQTQVSSGGRAASTSGSPSTSSAPSLSAPLVQATDTDSELRVSGPIQTRTEAIEQLRRIAEFFKRTEPHSPVAYLAEKAAKWGEMSLHDWLRSVIKDQGSLGQVEELLGVEPPKASD